MRLSATRASSAWVLSGSAAAPSSSSTARTCCSRREAHRGEVLPDRLVLAPGQEDHLGPLHPAPGAAHLLVVGDRPGRRAVVDHEAEVRLVEAHPEGRGGHERLHPVPEQVRLGGEALLLPRPARVGRHLEAPGGEVLGDLDGRRHGEGVDDPRAREVLEVVGQPGQALRLAGDLHHLEVEALPVERAPEDEDVLGARGDAEDRGHVLHHAGRRGRRGGEHRRPGGQLLEEGADPAVVRAEVVPPVRDAVRLVDHEEPAGRDQLGEHLVAELRVVQPLR